MRATPYTGGLSVSPIRILIIVNIDKGEVLHERPVLQEPVARVLKPPKLGLKVLDDLQGPQNQLIRLLQLSVANSFGPAVLRTRRTAHNSMEMTRGVYRPIVPFKDINLMVGPPLWVKVACDGVVPSRTILG